MASSTCILRKEDGSLRYDFMVSLQNMARVKIVSSLWMNLEIQREIKELYKVKRCVKDDLYLCAKTDSNEFEKKFLQIENKVFTNGWRLPLPEILFLNDRKIRNIIRQFGEELRYFLFRLAAFFAVEYIDGNILWTCRGHIDQQQTVKNILVNSGNGFNDDRKYKLEACEFCLEDEIAAAAPHFVEDYLNLEALAKYPMAYFWTARHTTDGDFDRPDNINELVMEKLTDYTVVPVGAYRVAIQFMWNNLSEGGKVRKVVNCCLQLLIGTDVTGFCSFLSNLNYEQQNLVFKEVHGFELFVINRHWLCEEYFLPTALHKLQVIDSKTYLGVISRAQEVIRQTNGEAKRKCQFVLKTLWLEANIDFKVFVLKSISMRELDDLFF